MAKIWADRFRFLTFRICDLAAKKIENVWLGRKKNEMFSCMPSGRQVEVI